MSKKEVLQNEIIEAIKKIESFSENNRFEVFSIYSNIYKKYRDLNREDFESEIEFDTHCANIKSKDAVIQLELRNLQDLKSTVDVQSNFAQVRITLHNLFV
ncbi:hypothetical protein [Flavobacterium chungangense]|uniref:hypothetical protein n=1 Tax=Flavobacterium chungangense TaxID=554283 RepID=UPI0004DFC9EF|nr:hypothetical protein [Flavobacterium chungangense]